MRRAHNHVRDSVAIDITRWRHRPAELAAEVPGLDLLEFRVVEPRYHCPRGAAKNENLAHILRWAEGEAWGSSIEIAILKGRAHSQIGHPVRVDITDLCDGASKLGSGIFRVRI